jgi:hypothetical protein
MPVFSGGGKGTARIGFMPIDPAMGISQGTCGAPAVNAADRCRFIYLPSCRPSPDRRAIQSRLSVLRAGTWRMLAGEVPLGREPG